MAHRNATAREISASLGIKPSRGRHRTRGDCGSGWHRCPDGGCIPNDLKCLPGGARKSCPEPCLWRSDLACCQGPGQASCHCVGNGATITATPGTTPTRGQRIAIAEAQKLHRDRYSQCMAKCTGGNPRLIGACARGRCRHVPAR